MRNTIQKCFGVILVLVALVVGATPVQAGLTATPLPDGSVIYWNPIGASTDGDDSNNWTDGPGSNSGAFLISGLSTYILSFDGTGANRNNACAFDGGTTCVGLQSSVAYSGVITIAKDNTLTVHGTFTLSFATRLVIESGGALVVDDVSRVGTTPNTLSVPVLLQVNATASGTYAGISGESTYGLTISRVISGSLPLVLGKSGISTSAITTLSAANTFTGPLKVVGGHVVISGSLPVATQVGVEEGAELQVDGSAGPVKFGPPATRGQGTPGRLMGRGQTGAITWYQPTEITNVPPSGTGTVAVLNGQGAPSQLRSASLSLATAAAEQAQLAVRVDALTNPGTGYSRLVSSGAVQIGANSTFWVDVTDLYASMGRSGLATGRIPGIVTHPAGQRTGYFMPGKVTINDNSQQGFSSKGARAPATVTLNPVIVPDYVSTGIDLVVLDYADLPVVSFASSTSTVFAGQAQATLGVVTVSPAPTTTVVVTYSDDIGTQVAIDPAVEFPSFSPGTTHSLVFKPGETVKAITTQIGTDTSATFNKTFSLTLTDVLGATIGTPSTDTVTIVRGVGTPTMTANGLAVTGSLTLTGTIPLGQPITVVVTGGLPPYSGLGANMTFFAGPLVMSGGGLPQQTFSAVATSLAAGSFSFNDANDVVAGAVTFTPQALVEASVTAPTLPLSPAPTTIYAPMCASTPEGLSNLLSTVAGVPAIDIAAYAWDAATQGYAKLPAQPSAGGLKKTHGVFVASRVPVAFDFNGAASPMYSEVVLRPGWNFVGIPPIDDGSTVITSHPWVHLLLFPTGTGVSAIVGVERDAYIGTAAYFWNGSAYSQVTTLSSGIGYWIKNNSTADLTLVRSPGTTGVARGAQGGGANANGMVLYRDAVTTTRAAHPSQRTADNGSPPPPPGGSSAAASSGNSCGFGSGIASLALLLSATFAFFLARRR